MEGLRIKDLEPSSYGNGGTVFRNLGGDQTNSQGVLCRGKEACGKGGPEFSPDESPLRRDGGGVQLRIRKTRSGPPLSWTSHMLLKVEIP